MAKRLKDQTKHLPLPLVLRVFDAWTLGFQSEQTLKHRFGLCQRHLPEFVMPDILINHSLAEELRRVPIKGIKDAVDFSRPVFTSFGFTPQRPKGQVKDTTSQ